MIRFSTDKRDPIDWWQAVSIFARAPLGSRKRDPEQLARAFLASYAVVYVFDEQTLVGMGRALCDGEYQAALYDIVLLPDYQNKGIGCRMVAVLCSQLPVENIMLYAVPGREGFYRKCGFRKMRTAMARLHPQAAPDYLEDADPWDEPRQPSAPE